MALLTQASPCLQYKTKCRSGILRCCTAVHAACNTTVGKTPSGRVLQRKPVSAPLIHMLRVGTPLIHKQMHMRLLPASH